MIDLVLRKEGPNFHALEDLAILHSLNSVCVNYFQPLSNLAVHQTKDFLALNLQLLDTNELIHLPINIVQACELTQFGHFSIFDKVRDNFLIHQNVQSL